MKIINIGDKPIRFKEEGGSHRFIMFVGGPTIEYKVKKTDLAEHKMILNKIKSLKNITKEELEDIEKLKNFLKQQC